MRVSASTMEVRILALRQGLMNEVRMWQVRLMDLHEIDAHEEGLRRTCVAVEIVERCLFDITIQERNADDALLWRVDVLAIDLELFLSWLPCIS